MITSETAKEIQALENMHWLLLLLISTVFEKDVLSIVIVPHASMGGNSNGGSSVYGNGLLNSTPTTLFPLPNPLPLPPSDPKKDAEGLFKNADKDAALLDLLPKRNFLQRQQMKAAFNELSPDNPYYPKDYKLFKGDGITNLKYAMDQMIPYGLFLEFLDGCLEVKPSYWWGPLIIALFTVSDLHRNLIIYLFRMKFKSSVYTFVEDQGGDYKNFLYEITKRQRENDSVPYTDQEVNDFVKNLKDEKGGWKDDRKHLDTFFLNKSRAFIKKTVPRFEKEINQPFSQAILDNIHDVNLQVGYNFLLQYALNPNEAIATRIHDAQTDPNDFGATKIAFIVAFSETTLANINAAFEAKYKSTISDFLLKSGTPSLVDKILAALVDNASGSSKTDSKPELSTAPAPPPVSPTQPVP